MKVYKLSEQDLKKIKKESIIFGLVWLLLCIVFIYVSITIDNDYTSTSVIFGIGAFRSFFALYKLDQFYFELDGKVIREYIRGKVRKESNLEQAQIKIIEHKKKPKMNVLDKNNVLAKYNRHLVSIDAFNELISDVKDILQQQEDIK